MHASMRGNDSYALISMRAQADTESIMQAFTLGKYVPFRHPQAYVTFVDRQSNNTVALSASPADRSAATEGTANKSGVLEGGKRAPKRSVFVSAHPGQSCPLTLKLTQTDLKDALEAQFQVSPKCRDAKLFHHTFGSELCPSLAAQIARCAPPHPHTPQPHIHILLIPAPPLLHCIFIAPRRLPSHKHANPNHPSGLWPSRFHPNLRATQE